MMTEKKLTRDEVDKLAKTLYKAYAKQKPLDMHEFPEFDDDSAYAIQRELTDLKAKKLLISIFAIYEKDMSAM